MAPSVIVWLSTATVSSPTTLLVSRNAAIDCVQIQVRVHSAQQQSRALLDSLLLSKMTISFVCVYFWATFPAGAKTATLLGPIRLQPAPVATRSPWSQSLAPTVLNLAPKQLLRNS